MLSSTRFGLSRRRLPRSLPWPVRLRRRASTPRRRISRPQCRRSRPAPSTALPGHSAGPTRRVVVRRHRTRENRRVQPELPTGTVTFLFTDIEGSTRLLGELGEEYADALAEHRRALREAWQRHDGVEVDTQGDAFFVALARASDAVAAAADAQ